LGKKPKIPHTNFNTHKKFARLKQEDIITKYPNITHIYGIDEVGTGAISGPAYLAGVLLSIDSDIQVKDSKKYATEKQRQKAAPQVYEKALWYKVEKIPAYKINEYGLGPMKNQATIRLLEEVLLGMDYKTTLVIVDGAYIPKLPHTLKNFTILAVPKADETITACSAASVIAKVSRDNYMNELAQIDEFEPYGFDKNKGYLTKEHMSVLKMIGISVQHRTEVKPIKELLNGRKNTI
jgi:ribonuclease HII